MTKTIEIPFISLVTQADPDWQADERLIRQVDYRKVKVDWRGQHPYNYVPEAPPGFVFVTDSSGALLMNRGKFLVAPAP